MAVGVFDRVNVVVLVNLITGGNVLVMRFTGRHRRTKLDVTRTVHSTSARHLQPVLVADVSAVLKLIPLMCTSNRKTRKHVTVNVTMINNVVISAFLALFVIPTVCDFVSASERSGVGGRRLGVGGWNG